MKILLFQPDIAANFGAALRISACFDVALEIIEPCGFPLTARALRRAAMDYGSAETVKRHVSWDAFLHTFPQNRESHPRRVLMTTKGASSLTSFTFLPDDILIFGSESAGVPASVHDNVDARLFIPMAGDARSLNLSTSIAITTFEAKRQAQYYP